MSRVHQNFLIFFFSQTACFNKKLKFIGNSQISARLLAFNNTFRIFKNVFTNKFAIIYNLLRADKIVTSDRCGSFL